MTFALEGSECATDSWKEAKKHRERRKSTHSPRNSTQFAGNPPTYVANPHRRLRIHSHPLKSTQEIEKTTNDMGNLPRFLGKRLTLLENPHVCTGPQYTFLGYERMFENTCVFLMKKTNMKCSSRFCIEEISLQGKNEWLFYMLQLQMIIQTRGDWVHCNGF